MTPLFLCLEVAFSTLADRRRYLAWLIGYRRFNFRNLKLLMNGGRGNVIVQHFPPGLEIQVIRLSCVLKKGVSS